MVVPQFVVDHVRTVAESPDLVTSRRARRGLESLEALRSMDVDVHIAPDEVPEVDDPTIKLLTVARRIGLRIGTCSSNVVDMAGMWELPVVDLRAVAAELSPDHLPGEVLFVELLREGRQPRQAVGYLPDGDMVVVNDASHLVGPGGGGRSAFSRPVPRARDSSSSPGWPNRPPNRSRSRNHHRGGPARAAATSSPEPLASRRPSGVRPP